MILRTLRALGGIAIFAVVFFAAGELAARLYFSSGESFSSHAGPIVERFERDFVFNRFDGPSRGPEPLRPPSPGQVRILVQGDSITWGQGVREEKDLFSSQLLSRLRAEQLDVEMAVLAYPGREIDDHIVQLDQWGEEIDPSIIVYVWFVNDMELERSRPGTRFRLWRRMPFHRTLMSNSYLWFFMDYALSSMLPTWAPTYVEHIQEKYRPGSEAWEGFADAFRQWASRAKGLAPTVVMALYPMGDGDNRVLAEIYAAVQELGTSEGIETIDLWEPLRQLARDNDLRATRYDSHPGEAAHARIAQALHQRLREIGALGSPQQRADGAQ